MVWTDGLDMSLAGNILRDYLPSVSIDAETYFQHEVRVKSPRFKDLYSSRMESVEHNMICRRIVNLFST